MLHPDYQYDATRIPELIAPIVAGEPRPDARQPLPGRPAGRRHAAVWKFVSNRFLTTSRTSPSSSTCPSTTPACAPTAGGCSRRSRTSRTATTSCSTRSSSPRSSPRACVRADRRDRRPDPLLRGGELGRLRAQRRVRRSRPSGRRPLPAPPPARPALAEAHGATSGRSLGGRRRPLVTGRARRSSPVDPREPAHGVPGHARHRHQPRRHRRSCCARSTSARPSRSCVAPTRSSSR